MNLAATRLQLETGEKNRSLGDALAKICSTDSVNLITFDYWNSLLFQYCHNNCD